MRFSIVAILVLQGGDFSETASVSTSTESIIAAAEITSTVKPGRTR